MMNAVETNLGRAIRSDAERAQASLKEIREREARGERPPFQLRSSGSWYWGRSGSGASWEITNKRLRVRLEEIAAGLPPR